MMVLMFYIMASLNFRDQKLKNTWNDKVVVNPTLNPFFSPSSDDEPKAQTSKKYFILYSDY